LSEPVATNSTAAAQDEMSNMVAVQRRAKETGELLRKHREALLASNPEMAEVWRTGLGHDDEARAAQRKIREFYLADTKGMEMEEAYMADMKALRETQDRMIEKMSTGEKRERFDPRASAGFEPRKGSPDGRPRSLSGGFEKRQR